MVKASGSKGGAASGHEKDADLWLVTRMSTTIARFRRMGGWTAVCLAVLLVGVAAWALCLAIVKVADLSNIED